MVYNRNKKSIFALETSLKTISATMKKAINILLVATLLLGGCSANSAQNRACDYADIVPKPLSVVEGVGEFSITSQTTLCCPAELHELSEYIRLYIPFKRTSELLCDNHFSLAIDPAMGAEAYKLDVTNEGVSLTGGGYGALFNGVQTVLQLLPRTYSKSANLPLSLRCGTICDAPRFGYRGLMLDVSRTFIPAESIKRYIDLIAYHKFNKLHLHLVDDEGWRVEIKSHPEFALEGSRRGGDAKVWARYGKFDESWGGYYTQQELRDIVAYASQRNIEVIPEIDMPGHSRALAQIYPDILCNYTPDKSKWGGRDLRNAWCVAKEQNYALIEDIVRELADIFPSPYIHIGGDEVALALGYHIWSKCPDCQQLMKEKGCNSYMQLQDIFTERVAAILKRYGKQPAVWNEAIEGGRLDKNTRVYGWQGTKHCKASIDGGFPTIVMPGPYFYLDMRQSPEETGHKWAGCFDTKHITTFDLAEQGFSPSDIERIAGVEAAFWSEIYIDNEPESCDYLDYMLFPRLCAVAEIGWCDNHRSWSELHTLFKRSHYNRLAEMGVCFRLEKPKVEVVEGKIVATTDDGSTLFYRDKFTNESHRYRAPIPAERASSVAFYSTYRTGHSADVALKSYYATLTPKVVVTSSMPIRKRDSLQKAEEYKTIRTSSAISANEWIEYRFESAVECRRITFATGHPHLHRCLLEHAYAEICYDGETFENVGRLDCGEITIVPKSKVYALRIVTDGLSDAEPSVIIQPLEISD